MKILKIVVILIILLFSVNTYATQGPVKQNSIIECNGTYYGKHGTPAHWHVVEKKNDKWVSLGNEVDLPPCYIRIPNTKEKVTFSKCSDGDTAWFIINKEERKVRFLAIDTPEISGDNGPEKYSREASEYTCNAIKNAKEIFLEYDGASDKEDKYGRILAFVHVDGVLLEKSLIERGLAKVEYIYGDYEYVDELREVETIAKEKKLGIWNDEELLPDKEETIDMEDTKEDTNLLVEIINILKKIFALIFN